MAGSAPIPRDTGRLDVALLLSRWRHAELAYASTFDQCAGANPTDIEDLYDATSTRLLAEQQEFGAEEHLRGALRRGIRLRALRMHRDHRVRKRVLDLAAPGMIAERELRASREEPEQALLAREDDLIVGEFLAELTPLERRVFALIADGRSWRAIATSLGLSENEARNATRACERKREHFTTLYSTGRLCGYRSHTIGSLLAGRERSEIALAQAYAHLRHCHACQAHHKASAETVRAAFDARVLVVLPIPVVFASRSGLPGSLHAVVLRVARFFQRGTVAQGGVRERTVEVIAGSSASAKIAAGLASVALVAGGTVGAIGATHAHTHRDHRPHRTYGIVATSQAHLRVPDSQVRHASRPGPAGLRVSRRLPIPSQQHTAGGLAYLGVASPPRPSLGAPTVVQHGGGPFGP